MSEKNWDRVPIDAQSIDAPLSRAAVFLVVTVASEPTALTKVCLALDGLDDLVKTVGFRDLPAQLSCIVGIGCSLWGRLHFDKQPLELRPFAPITIEATPNPTSTTAATIPPTSRARLIAPPLPGLV